MTKKTLFHGEATEYLASMDVTPAERHELLAWVAEGHGVYDNPWHMADEKGRTMDYITAMREAESCRPKNDRTDCI